MSLLRSLPQRWARLREAARREFLRDPDIILFERAGGTIRDGGHGR